VSGHGLSALDMIPAVACIAEGIERERNLFQIPMRQEGCAGRGFRRHAVHFSRNGR
jgi:hypothetical protein